MKVLSVLRRLTARLSSAAMAGLVLVALPGACALSEEGTTVELNIVTEGRVLQSDRASLVVVISELELLPCAPGLAARLQRLLIADAFAHTESSPTRLGTPVVVDVRAQQTVLAGILEPPPGDYCGLRVFISPADEDALGLEMHPNMLHRSAALMREDETIIGTTAAYEFRIDFPSTELRPERPTGLSLYIQPDSMPQPSAPQGDGPLREWMLTLPQLTRVQVSAL